MTWVQYVGIAIVIVVLTVGLLGPPVLLWWTNVLVDRYEALDKED